MSWEYTEYTKPCPCGKGQIRVVHGSNDWGQTSHDETILCPVCREQDELEKAAKAERKRIANHKIAIVLEYFRENYLDRLVNEFVDTKSKKAIWKRAYEIGLETYSESSFYKHTRSETIVIEEYVKGKTVWRNLKKLASYLQVKDSKFEELYNDAASHIKEFEDEEARLAYMWAKGR